MLIWKKKKYKKIKITFISGGGQGLVSSRFMYETCRLQPSEELGSLRLNAYLSVWVGRRPSFGMTLGVSGGIKHLSIH